MILEWETYKKLKQLIDSGVDNFTAIAMTAASEIPIIGPILMWAAGGLLKWSLKFLIDNVIPHKFQPTIETDPDWAKRKGVPLSPDVDPESWSKEGKMRWQEPKNQKIFEELKEITKDKPKPDVNDMLIPLSPLGPSSPSKITPPMINMNPYANLYRYYEGPATIEVFDDNKKSYLDHPFSKQSSNAAFPGLPQGRYKRTTDRILTVHDLLNNKKNRK